MINKKLIAKLEAKQISKTERAIQYLEKEPNTSINEAGRLFSVSHQSISRQLRKMKADAMGVCPSCGQTLPHE